MLAYKPAYARTSMGQAPMISPSIAPSSAPTPVIDTVFAGYEGVPGVLASAAILAVAGTAAYVGIKTGLEGSGKVMKTAGWIGGVGSALLGLLYLGQKSGLSIGTGIPGVNVYPA